MNRTQHANLQCAARKNSQRLSLVVLFLLMLLAAGCHLTGSDKHIRSMHVTSDDEEYCLDTTGAPGLNSGLFYSFLGQTLYGDTGHPENWDKAPNGTNHIYFVPVLSAKNNCGIMPFATWVYVLVKDSTTTECGGSNYSCVLQTGAINDPPVCDYDHCHGSKPRVYFKTSHVSGLNDAARHVVNHEFGHVFGLDDPYPGPADTTWTKCEVLNQQAQPEWIDSVMHAPDSYCEDVGEFRAWPTQLDLWGVGAQIQQP